MGERGRETGGREREEGSKGRERGRGNNLVEYVEGQAGRINIKALQCIIQTNDTIAHETV